MATIRHIHTINDCGAPVVDDEDVYFLEKTFKAGVPQRLVADRTGGTLHYVRNAYHLGAEKATKRQLL